jgi:D-lactate dehydrogenase
MKAAMFSVHRFERKVFDNANREGTHEIAYIAAALDATTVPLAEGCAAVIPSPHDAMDTATLQLQESHSTSHGASCRLQVGEKPQPQALVHLFLAA